MQLSVAKVQLCTIKNYEFAINMLQNLSLSLFGAALNTLTLSLYGSVLSLIGSNLSLYGSELSLYSSKQVH